MKTNMYQRHACLGSAELTRLFAGRLLKHTGRFLRADSAESYTHSSSRQKPGDPARPMWSNLGYWKDARVLADACADLARKLAQAAGLQGVESVLDVGCGCAEQDVLWVREFDVGRILGLDITPLRVELANAGITHAGLQQRIEVRHGSATACPFDNESFDRVTALECAFHFRTREMFFAEAWRLLKPGGRIATADLLPAPGVSNSLFRRQLHKIGRRHAHIPEANHYDRECYRSKLEAAGFVNVKIESIGDYVFPGIARLFTMAAPNQNVYEIEVEPDGVDLVADDWPCSWRDLAGLEDYVIVSADKPVGAEAH